MGLEALKYSLSMPSPRDELTWQARSRNLCATFANLSLDSKKETPLRLFSNDVFVD